MKITQFAMFDEPRLKRLAEDQTPLYRICKLGAQACSFQELLSVLIGGSNQLEVAEIIASRWKTPLNLMAAPLVEIGSVRGVGPARGARIKAAFELGRLVTITSMVERPSINSPADAANLVQKHAWDFGKPVYISLRKITRETIISSTTLNKTIKGLIYKGYIHVVNRGEGLDRRIRYDIAGIYFALALSIRSNPNSKFCKRVKNVRNLLDFLPEETQKLVINDLPHDERITIGMINNILNQKGFYVNWSIRRSHHKIYDGPIKTNKLSTNDVMSRIRGEDLYDDFDGYRKDVFDG